MKIGVVGYGKMGTGIFRLLASRDFPVVVLTRDEAKREANEQRFFKSLRRAVKRGRISAEDYERKKREIRFTVRYRDLGDVDLVIETAAEDPTAKLKIFESLEEVVGAETILATNTSSISIAQLAQRLKRPERFCGLHFFYPVVLIDLIEIIRTRSTPARTIDLVRQFCRRLGKKCIAVLDAPGSVLNAILSYYYIESLYILEEGRVPPSRLDRLAKRYFYVGPCESMDIIGIDFFAGALERVTSPDGLCPLTPDWESNHELPREWTGGREGYYLPRLLRTLLEEERLGRKVSRGLYLYRNEKPYDDDMSFYQNPQATYLCRAEQSEDFIARRLFYAVANGALHSLAEGMASMDELDLGVREILQMEQGPFSTLRSLGLDVAQAHFDELSRKVGKRFRQEHVGLLQQVP